VRLLELRLLAFGPFAGETIDLAEGGAMLELLHGPNEAGKSTALRAITDLLYGVPATTPDAHRHAPAELRIGGRLLDARGAELAVVRRKGRKDTLLDPAGRPLDETALARSLGGVGRSLFLTMFGLDHRTLREGAQALLRAEGALGESLFDAGGARGVQAVLERLRRECDAIYKPRGQSPALNETLARFKEAKKRVALASLSAEGFSTQKQALEEARAEHAILVGERQALGAEQHRLLRALAVLPFLAKRRELSGRLAALADAPPLGPEARERRLGSLRAVEEANRDDARLADEIAALERRRDALEIPETLLDLEEAVVTDLELRVGGHRQAQRDLPRRLGELAALEQQAAALWRALGREPSPDAALPGVDASTGARVERLGAEHAALASTLTHLDREIAEHAGGAALLARRAAALGAPTDLGPLRTALGRARRAGDLDEICARRRSDADAMRARALRCLGSLALDADLDVRAATALPVPPVETLAHFATRWDGLEAETRTLEAETRTLERAEARTEHAWGELTAAGDVPSEAELDAARVERSLLWNGLRPALGGARARPGSEQIAAFEAAVARADSLADRLRREAARVSTHARLASEQRRLSATRSALESERAALGGRRAALEQAWAGLWAEVPVAARSPAEMQGWRERFAGLVDIAAALDGAEREAAIAHERRAELARELGEALASVRVAPLRGGDALAPVVDAAEAALARLEARERERAQLEDGHAALAAQETRLGAARKQAERERAAWSRAWSEAVARIGLAPTTTVEEAIAVLATLRELGGKEREVAELRRRIRGMERDAAELEGDVGALVSARAPELGERPPEVAAAELVRRWRHAQRSHDERTRLEDEIEARRTERAAVAERRRAAEGDLAALMRLAGVATPEALAQAEERALERAAVTAQRIEVEDALLAAGEGASLEQIEAMARGVEPDRVRARLDEIEDRCCALNDDIDALSRRIGTTQSGLAHLESHAGAADAAADAETALASVARLGRRYLHARLAVLVLEQEMERYRQEHQGPVLARAAELFSELTLGAWRSLRGELDEHDQAVLRCVRANGATVDVAALSDGTRDQLYLGLRLASIERYAARATAMPLVLDDVLIHFDDERAAAALAVLQRFTSVTQILFFTHHARIVELARQTLPPGSWREHRLERSGSPGRVTNR
jgi:uncharacterized protein YhaN